MNDQVLSVDRERLKSTLLELAEIGAEPGGGVTRLAYSAEEARARAWLAEQYASLGLEVRLDAAGNLLARYGGRESAPVVMTGSHIDTVPRGGRFDGAAGCIAALEVARLLTSAGLRTARPVEFVAFAAEESPRFKSAHRFGSRAMAGQVSAGDAARLVDGQGVTVAEAMKRVGLDPERLDEAKRSAAAIAAFVELHIEQGTELARGGIPVGIVTSIAGTRRYQIELTGRPDHSGGTPMGQRRDALAAAAEIVLAMEHIAVECGGTLVGTVTMLTITPNAMNVVPGRAALGIDIRDSAASTIEMASQWLLTTVEMICEQRGVEVSVTCLRDTPPTPLSEGIQAVIAKAAERAGVPARRVPSHTGHDVISLGSLTETGMIFVRNRSGRSHSPDESMEWDDYCAATAVLLETVLALARIENA